MRFGLDVKRFEGRTRRRLAPFQRCLAPFLWLALCGSLAAVLPACEEEHTLEPTINARPGVVQGSADGPLLDEDDACEQLRTALLEAVESNSCDDVAVADCPDLIRPAGSLACVRYAQGSVEECVEAVGGFDSCNAFVGDACIVVAVVDSESEGCVPPGPAGDGDGGTADSGASTTDTATDNSMTDGATSSTTVGTDTVVLDGGETSAVADAGDESVPDASAPGDASVPPDPATDAGETAPDTSTSEATTGSDATFSDTATSDGTSSDTTLPTPAVDAGADAGL